MDATVALDRDEALVAELHRLSVTHLARLTSIEYPEPVAPGTLIAGLAASSDARVQAALLLLFLRQPSYSHYLSEALDQLSETDCTTLKLYYQAAVYLQPELAPVLQAALGSWRVLPDCFSAELDLPLVGTVSSTDALTALGQRHEQLSGRTCNWSGSYRQNIPRFLKHLHRTHGNHELRTAASIS